MSCRVAKVADAKEQCSFVRADGARCDERLYVLVVQLLLADNALLPTEGFQAQANAHGAKQREVQLIGCEDLRVGAK